MRTESWEALHRSSGLARLRCKYDEGQPLWTRFRANLIGAHLGSVAVVRLVLVVPQPHHIVCTGASSKGFQKPWRDCTSQRAFECTQLRALVCSRQREPGYERRLAMHSS